MATKGAGEAPRAVIHKRILDSAAADPDATVEALAASVAGASPDLVERVLEEYGDPGRAAPATPRQDQEASMTATERELTDKEREALRTIAADPEATQEELAEALGVSRATVNKRVNGIPGFEWADRRAFVESVLGDDAIGPDAEGAPESTGPAEDPAAAAAASDGGRVVVEADGAVEQLRERLARLERAVGDAPPGDGPPFGDTELTAKVVRAVMADDAISEDEELRVLEALF